MNKFRIKKLSKSTILLILMFFICSCKNLFEPPTRDYKLGIIPPYPIDNMDPNQDLYGKIVHRMVIAINSINHANANSKKNKFIPKYPLFNDDDYPLETASSLKVIKYYQSKIMRNPNHKTSLSKLAKSNDVDLIIYGRYDGDDKLISYQLYLFDTEKRVAKKLPKRSTKYLESYWNGDEHVLAGDFKIHLKELLNSYFNN